MSLPLVSKLTECPHCGCDEFTLLIRWNGKGRYSFKFNGEPGFCNSGMHDGLSGTSTRTAYCTNCMEPIAKNDKLKPGESL